ncbi:MAG: hypothetical protein O2923_00380 [Verrucomicrobia bacterium]|nr:hypothetical protein [Verrucomicrobiota bacterium]MDA1085592.1 hypothetical protein [Verrucomicrobiota bacterium]
MNIWKRILIAALFIGSGYCIARTASGGLLQGLAVLLIGFEKIAPEESRRNVHSPRRTAA